MDKIQEKIDTEIRDSTGARIIEQINDMGQDTTKEDLKIMKK